MLTNYLNLFIDHDYPKFIDKYFNTKTLNRMIIQSYIVHYFYILGLIIVLFFFLTYKTQKTHEFILEVT